MTKLRLVTDSLSHDTVEAMQALLDDAKAGKLVGAAIVGMYKRGEYIVNAAGMCREQPSLTIGPATMLIDQLIMMERGR